jgi:lipopolysaccharide export system permease protein
MRLPWTLSYYIGKHFLLSILLALFGLIAISMLVDVVELIRRASGKDDVPMGVILELTALRIPYMLEKLAPYAVLVGSMLALTRLTRTQELVVARAAGVSVWQFLGPAIAVVMGLGLFLTTVFNPFAAALLLRYEHIEGKYLTGTPSLLSLTSSGLWLRQIENNEGDIGEHIVYTMRVSQSTMEFSNVIVFTFDKAKKFVERLDAERGVLDPGMLQLYKVTRSVPGEPTTELADYQLPTTLTLSRIQDSFASPETMSFWRLPSFVNMLENAGFSALRHRLYWQSLLANPFLMAGTVLVAAVFSLRQPRRGRIGLLVVAGVTCGFLLHFFTDIIFALGAAGTLPIALAAWSPAFVVIMAGAALLLHLEDG